MNPPSASVDVFNIYSMQRLAINDKVRSENNEGRQLEKHDMPESDDTMPDF